MSNSKVSFSNGMLIVLFLLTVLLIVSTVTGAIVLWALSVLGVATFSWMKAFAVGIILAVVANLLKHR